jgi:hypothetical protein
MGQRATAGDILDGAISRGGHPFERHEATDVVRPKCMEASRNINTIAILGKRKPARRIS